jgi:urocanate hydratase
LSASSRSNSRSHKGRNVGIVLLIIVVVVGASILIATFLSPSSQGDPAPFLGALNAKQVSCSLSNGTCSMIIVNNSTVSLKLDYCYINVRTNGPNTTFSLNNAPNGSLGGQAAASGIPANSTVTASCTISTSYLSNESKGSTVYGTMTATSNGQWYSSPAGTSAGVNFVGTWS